MNELSILIGLLHDDPALSFLTIDCKFPPPNWRDFPLSSATFES